MQNNSSSKYIIISNKDETNAPTDYVDYRRTLINIPCTDKPTISAYNLLYGYSHKLTLDMVETTVLLDLLIKENNIDYKIMEFQGRAIAFETYVMFMKKYKLDYEGKTINEMALEIHKYELAHEQDIIIGLYINGLY